MEPVDEALAERLDNRRHEQYDRAGEQQIAMALAVTRDQQRHADDEKCGNEINHESSLCANESCRVLSALVNRKAKKACCALPKTMHSPLQITLEITGRSSAQRVSVLLTEQLSKYNAQATLYVTKLGLVDTTFH